MSEKKWTTTVQWKVDTKHKQIEEKKKISDKKNGLVNGCGARKRRNRKKKRCSSVKSQTPHIEIWHHSYPQRAAFVLETANKVFQQDTQTLPTTLFVWQINESVCLVDDFCHRCERTNERVYIYSSLMPHEFSLFLSSLSIPNVVFYFAQKKRDLSLFLMQKKRLKLNEQTISIWRKRRGRPIAFV